MPLALAVGLLAVACATTPPPKPVLFGASEAFRHAQRRIVSFIHADIDGDGRDEAIAAERLGPGLAAVVYYLAGDDPAAQGWRRGCQAEVAEGEELAGLALWQVAERPYVLLSAAVEDPEGRHERAVLSNPRAGCATVWQGQAVLPQAAGPVVAPLSVPGGIRLADGVLSIVDQPKYLGLDGEAGRVYLLIEVRLRRVGVTAAGVGEKAERLGLLTTPALRVRRAGDPMPALADADLATRLVAPAGEVVRLTVEADTPLWGLEIDAGCPASDGPTLPATPGDTEPYHWAVQIDAQGGHYVAGALPAVEGPVRAVGRSRIAAGLRRDLLLFTGPTTRLELRLGPEDVPRCLAELKGFGVAGPTPPPSATSASGPAAEPAEAPSSDRHAGENARPSP